MSRNQNQEPSLAGVALTPGRTYVTLGAAIAMFLFSLGALGGAIKVTWEVRGIYEQTVQANVAAWNALSFEEWVEYTRQLKAANPELTVPDVERIRRARREADWTYGR